jgi:hypothetical protein
VVVIASVPCEPPLELLPDVELLPEEELVPLDEDPPAEPELELELVAEPGPLLVPPPQALSAKHKLAAVRLSSGERWRVRDIAPIYRHQGAAGKCRYQVTRLSGCRSHFRTGYARIAAGFEFPIESIKSRLTRV